MKYALLAGISFALAVSTVVTAAAQTGTPDLNLGDQAPALDVTFLKNGPVNLEEGRGKHVYVVEFWATWCPPCKESIPHLSKLQNKYKKDGLKVVGITTEDEPFVNLYLKDMGKKMEYTVAVDDQEKTTTNYMAPFGLTGIPTAFLVDKAGRLAWYGNPMDPQMESMLKRLLDETPAPKGGAENT